MVIPKRVLIVGGTHGNEWTGIQIVQHYQDLLREQFPNLQLEFVLANPEAYRLNRRFKDEDLNRAFEFLHENRMTYEHQRAKELKETIQNSPCFIIDIHTTTSSMGNTVIISDYNLPNLAICKKLSRHFKGCKFIGAPDPSKKYLASQSSFGLILEIGPVANSVVMGESLESAHHLIQSILEVIDNQEGLKIKGELEIYEEIKDVYYPLKSNGELDGYLHPNFQNKNFKGQKGKIIPFKTFKGEDLTMNLNETLFPIFINEAAYYPHKLAFTFCRKKKLIINAMRTGDASKC